MLSSHPMRSPQGSPPQGSPPPRASNPRAHTSSARGSLTPVLSAPNPQTTQGSPHQGVPLPKASSTQGSPLIRPADLRPHCSPHQPTKQPQPTKHQPAAAYKPQHITVFCGMPLPHGRRDSSGKIAQSRAAAEMHGKSTHAAAAKKLNPLIVRIFEWCSEAIHTVLNRLGTKG